MLFRISNQQLLCVLEGIGGRGRGARRERKGEGDKGRGGTRAYLRKFANIISFRGSIQISLQCPLHLSRFGIRNVFANFVTEKHLEVVLQVIHVFLRLAVTDEVHVFAQLVAVVEVALN